MNITPIYELRTQLRTAAIAGTSLLPENFRLKKAAENFAAISSASPVFAKISEQLNILLKENTPQALIDTITLVDSVITVLASVGTAAEITPVKHTENRTTTVNIPYSRLSALITALTTSGGGNFSIVNDAWETDKEIFHDYRVMPALISALGASYGELAALASDIIIEVGSKNVIPVLKKDFDPKGKKDMARRVEIIENICGSEENDFYLELCETAEKEIKRELIFALSYDEANTEKLIELTKTERGKNKKAALWVLSSFDNENAAKYINEYSVKKPAEIIEIMCDMSSEWTSDLTARLIERLLVDENGNAVTFSQAADTEHCKLKEKVTYTDLMKAMQFKFGEKIEKIYRDNSNGTEKNELNHLLSIIGAKKIELEGGTAKINGYEQKSIGIMSHLLGSSIAATNNDGLKKLAVDLNNAPDTKGKYLYDEIAARVLSSGDFTDWMEKQLKMPSLNHKKPLIFKAVLSNIRFENGSYVFLTEHYSHIRERYLKKYIPVDQPLKGRITDILIKNEILPAGWIDPNDSIYCEKLGNYYCKMFKKEPNIGWLNLMGKCGLKNVKGLACIYFKHNNNSIYSIQSFFVALPGDKEYKRSEINDLIESVRKRKIASKIDIVDLKRFAEKALDE